MRIIILGPPGTGKGTQAQGIAKKFQLEHISTGKLFRQELAKGTELGKEAEGYWGKGNFVPDEIVIKLVNEKLPEDKYFLDGYPRNITQAEALEKHKKTDIVFYIDSDLHICVERLLKRAKIEGREDDTPAVIEHRFAVYKKETEPLLKFYKEQEGTRFFTIDGNRKPEEIFNEIVKLLEQWL